MFQLIEIITLHNIREKEICIKEYITSEAEKEHVVKNLAAHLIEQWTGFINFSDETDNWLKESIVQYLQYIATDKVTVIIPRCICVLIYMNFS